MPEQVHVDLVDSGLTELEAKAYLALLDHYKLSAKELSQVTGIFRTQMYDVLKGLIIKGFCTEVFDKVKTYVPVDPELALRNSITEFDRKSKTATNLSRQLHQRFLLNTSDQHCNEKMLEVLRSPNAVRKRLKAYIKETSKVILSFNKPPYQLRFNKEKGEMITLQNTDDKNIIHRAMFQIDSSDPQFSLQVAKSFAQQGESVRLSRFLPMKLMIFDNTRVFFQLAADNTFSQADTATFIRHPEITLTLINSFWVEWNRSLTISQFQKELEEYKNPSSKAKSVPITAPSH